jgi:hypothetical protein
MRTLRNAPLLVGLAALTLLAACSSGSGHGSGAPTSTAPATTAPSVTRPAGPVATVAPLSGGKGIRLVSAATGPKLDPATRVEAEYSVAGTAASYQSQGPLPANGEYHLVTGPTAGYKTRIVVRRPASAADFNGTVVVEWLNVSGGLDAAPDFTYLASELVRGGYAWVGVSAQKIGVEGGVVAVNTPVSAQGGAGKGLRNLDPARYASLHHPGDAFSYDIFTQVARTLRSPGKVDPLGGLHIGHVLAMGESQSAFALTTYVDGVQPLAEQYDGFLIHSRGGAAAPLGKPGQNIDITSTLGGQPTKIRTDGKAPVLVLQTETDVAGILDYYPATQPDSATFRLWEVAGTAHVDKYQLGNIAAYFGCPAPINAGPDHFVADAALHELTTWVDHRTPPPHAARLDVVSPGHYALDANGNAKGGVRTPVVDVPVDTLSGLPEPNSSVVCILAGSTKPLSAARLAALYPSRAEYLAAFTRSTDVTVKAGFVLAADRAALLAEAQPTRIAG